MVCKNNIIENQHILHSNQLVLHHEILNSQATLGNVMATLEAMRTRLDMLQQKVTNPYATSVAAPSEAGEDFLAPTAELQCSLNTAVSDFSDFPFLDPFLFNPFLLLILNFSRPCVL